MNWKKWLAVVLVGVCFLMSTYRSHQAGYLLEKDRHHMMTFAIDTLIEFTIYAKESEPLFTEMEQEIRRLEQLLSVTIEESEVGRLNELEMGESLVVSEETFFLLSEAKRFSKETNGAFDIAIAPLVQAWGFTTEEALKVPEEEEIERLLPLLDSADILLNADTREVSFAREGMKIDLGGIAKGYISQVIMEMFREHGITDGLLYFGGSVSAMGMKGDQTSWKIAIENPQDAQDYIGILTVTDTFVVTSGGTQRYFIEEGKLYHHILDKRTGYPSESGLQSVTVICDDGVKADVYSTALYVMGLEAGLKFWREEGGFEAIFLTDTGEVVATAGIADEFMFEGRQNGYIYSVVE